MEEEWDHLWKIIVAGKNKVGKATLTHSFTEPCLYENHRTSTGGDVYVKTTNIDTLERRIKIKLQIWVIGSQERFSSIRSMYYQGASGYILVFDLTNLDSFKNLVSWIYEIQNYRRQDTPIILVGNKRDLVDQRNVTKNEIELFRKTFKLEYYETSAKTGESVDHIFYTLNRLILANIDRLA